MYLYYLYVIEVFYYGINGYLIYICFYLDKIKYFKKKKGFYLEWGFFLILFCMLDNSDYIIMWFYSVWFCEIWSDFYFKSMMI